MEEVILIGYGGHAKSVADSIERQGKYHIAGYTDCEKRDAIYEYLGTDDVLKALFDKGIRKAVIGIGYLGKDDIRERLYERLKRLGFSLPVIVDPSASLAPSAILGEGSFLGKHAVVNTDAVVGKTVIINTNAVIEHDCRVGDFSHVAVNAVLCGGVDVGKGCLIGANATILQTVKVGDSAIIGAGTVVDCDIEKGGIVKHRQEYQINSSRGGYIRRRKLSDQRISFLANGNPGIFYVAERMVA